MQSYGNVFDDIYLSGRWGELSGPGSKQSETVSLCKHVNRFIKEHRITSVIDIGCGCGQLVKLMFGGIEPSNYLGIDCSKISVNQAKNVNAGYTFLVLDITESSIDRKYDLAFCKDFFQHMPMSDCIDVLRKVRNISQHIMIIEDLPTSSTDCGVGGYCPKDFISLGFTEYWRGNVGPSVKSIYVS